MNNRIGFLVFVVLITSGVISENAEDEDITVETVDETIPDIAYESPVPSDPRKVYFADHFDDRVQFQKHWIKSQAKKDGLEEDMSKYDGIWDVESASKDSLPNDRGLVLKTKAKHGAISSSLSKPFVFDEKPLILQYEVLLQEGQECGGSYIKLLSEGPQSKNLNNFHDKTPYTIMFGPDKCGNDHKLHFIFRHRNPLNGSLEEKHCQKPKERLEEYFSDKLPHLYRLIINPDNSFEISIDRKVVNSGSLLEDFVPPVNPPAEIDDPFDTKPEDWDEREKIPDPEATKPADWDEDAPPQIFDEAAVMPDGWLENEPSHIPDQDAVKPADWDSDMDGEWEPPLIENPACQSAVGCGHWEPPLVNNPTYKGKWRAPMIDNPNYKGKWRPKKIANPDFFYDKEPFRMTTVSAVGFEIWSMSLDVLFDNILITEDVDVAEKWAADTFDKKRQKIAKDSKTWWGKMMRGMNYRPKTWAAYAVYCLVPIVFYGYYLYRCVREESFVQRLAGLTNEYPVLWAVYILVLAVPVVFLLYLCCKPSSSASQIKEKGELLEAAEKKKTDELTEDVEDNEANEVEDNETNEVEDPEANEVEDNEANEVEEIEEAEVDDNDEEKEKNSEPDSDEDNEAVEQEQGEPKSKPSGEGARKRKVRKE